MSSIPTGGNFIFAYLSKPRPLFQFCTEMSILYRNFKFVLFAKTSISLSIIDPLIPILKETKRAEQINSNITCCTQFGSETFVATTKIVRHWEQRRSIKDRDFHDK